MSSDWTSFIAEIDAPSDFEAIKVLKNHAKNTNLRKKKKF